MVRGSYQNRRDRLPIRHVSFAFACRGYRHIIGCIIRNCCIIHRVFPSSVTVITPRGPLRSRATLLETKCFFIIRYNNCNLRGRHCAFSVAEVAQRNGVAGWGEKEENERIPPAGGRTPFKYPRTNSHRVSPGSDWTWFWCVISQAVFHDWTSNGDEAVGFHALHAWLFEKSAWERSTVSPRCLSSTRSRGCKLSPVLLIWRGRQCKRRPWWIDRYLAIRVGYQP